MGGYFYDGRINTLPVFINYDKADSVSETIKYADRFIDRETLIAMSKNNRRINSDDMKKFIYSKENRYTYFYTKNKDDSNSKEFYYLGLAYFVDIKEVKMVGKPICEIFYKLDKPVRKDIYDFIVE